MTASEIGAPTAEPAWAGWWVTHLKAHPFRAASLAVLCIGGACLLLFFVRLGVMPDLDLAGASATMAAVALIGVLVGFVLAGSTLAVGVATRSLRDSQPTVFGSFWTIAALVAPAALAFVVMAVWINGGAHGSAATLVWSVLGVMVLCALVRVVFLWRAGMFRRVEEAPRQVHVLEAIVGLLGAGFIWCLMPLIAFIFFAALWPLPYLEKGFGASLIFWGAVCIAMNVCVAYLPKERELVGIAFIGTGSVAILLALTQNWLAIPLAAVRVLGLGDVPVALVLTEQGCHTLNMAARGQSVCRLDPDTKTGWACPVVLQSRIGSPLVVEVSSFDVDGRWPVRQDPGRDGSGQRHAGESALRYQRIQLSKTQVLSWPTIKPLPRPGDNFLFDSKRLVGQEGAGDAGAMSQEQSHWLEAQCGVALVAGPQH